MSKKAIDNEQSPTHCQNQANLPFVNKYSQTNLKLWERHIAAGNACFHAQQNLAALAHYQRSITCAQDLFSSNMTSRDAVDALIISHHNLADLFCREKCYEMAEMELREVHQALCSALEKEENLNDISDALIWGVSRCYFALTMHMEKHNLDKAGMPPA